MRFQLLQDPAIGFQNRELKWIEKSATIVGGCCEVGPSYISYIHEKLKSKNYNIIPVLKN